MNVLRADTDDEVSAWYPRRDSISRLMLLIGITVLLIVLASGVSSCNKSTAELIAVHHVTNGQLTIELIHIENRTNDTQRRYDGDIRLWFHSDDRVSDDVVILQSVFIPMIYIIPCVLHETGDSAIVVMTSVTGSPDDQRYTVTLEKMGTTWRLRKHSKMLLVPQITEAGKVVLISEGMTK